MLVVGTARHAAHLMHVRGFHPQILTDVTRYICFIMSPSVKPVCGGRKVLAIAEVESTDRNSGMTIDSHRLHCIQHRLAHLRMQLN